jgi:hypothetical protein
MTNNDKKLLVYIPCHSDFDLAVEQAKKIKNEFKENWKNTVTIISKIEVIISVNYAKLSDHQINIANSVSDMFIDNSQIFLADANIAHGFQVAYQRKSDFLWILSANDELHEFGLSKMISSLHNDIDLLVTRVPEVNMISSVDNVINPAIDGYSFGLISGVIYNCQSLSKYFNVSEFFIWTGWSQLAVIQNAINQENGLKISTINTFEIYKQKQTSAKELAIKYGHSFYGYIILGYVFSKNKKDQKKFVRNYIVKNTFRFLLYKRKAIHSNQVIDPKNYLSWNQNIAEALIKHTSLILYFYYYCVSKLPFSLFARKLNKQKGAL